MAKKQVHPEFRARLFCAVASPVTQESRDNLIMGFRFHRSVKLFPGLRLNFGKRGISASIGVRGAHVTYGPTGTRTTVGLPGSGLSYTHLETRHRAVPRPSTAEPPAFPDAQGSAARGSLWIGLILVAIFIAIARLIASTSPVPPPAPAQTVARPAAGLPARTADDVSLAETKRAALGVAQIRHAVANSNTLRLSRVMAMPTGAICYQVHLRNSHGVAYVRTAVMDGPVVKISGSDGFTALWNRRCAHQSDGRDMTSEVGNVTYLPTT